MLKLKYYIPAIFSVFIFGYPSSSGSVEKQIDGQENYDYLSSSMSQSEQKRVYRQTIHHIDSLNDIKGEGLLFSKQDWIKFPLSNAKEQKANNLIQSSRFLIERGRFQEGIDLARRALDVGKDIRHLFVQIRALEAISNAYQGQKDFDQAIDAEKQRLLIAKRTEHTEIQSLVLRQLSQVYVASKQLDAGLERALQAASIGETLLSDILAYIHVAQILDQKNLPSSSIVYHKKAINSIEKIRADNINLSPELQAYFLGRSDNIVGWSDVYVGLASRLLRQDRVVEALLSLDLLKARELKKFLNDNKLEGNARQCFIEAEKYISKSMRKCLETLPEEQEIFELLSLDENLKLAHSYASRVEQLDHVLARKASSDNLNLATYFEMQNRLGKLGQRSALFYPLILKDRLELVLFTRNAPPVHYPVSVSKPVLEQVISKFRKQMETSRVNVAAVQETAQLLYTWMIAPIEADLKKANVETLIYAPDGPMRYVPLAALYDGRQWLIEQYEINYLTALGLTTVEPHSLHAPRILAGAFTDLSARVTIDNHSFEFGPISAAKDEVKSLSQRFPKTQTLTKTDFSRERLTPTQLNRYNIVHLATHGHLVAGNPEESFILLNNDEYISLREIKDWQLPNVDLVVLSACQTALGEQLGSGIEIIGFGYQLQQAQARASISTLWNINDTSTNALMNEFYAHLKLGSPHPVDALRKAQIALIKGQSVANRGGQRSSLDPPSVQGGTLASIDRDRTHPYYWAPFILIGNGL